MLIEDDPSTSMPTLISHVKKYLRIQYLVSESMVGKAKGHWKYLQQLENIIPQFTQIFASYAGISSWYGRREGNTINALTRWSNSTTIHEISSSFLEFQTVYQWVSILQAHHSGRWNIVGAILPRRGPITRAMASRLQEDWVRDAREGPRILMSLRVDFGPMG